MDIIMQNVILITILNLSFASSEVKPKPIKKIKILTQFRMNHSCALHMNKLYS